MLLGWVSGKSDWRKRAGSWEQGETGTGEVLSAAVIEFIYSQIFKSCF